MAFKTRKLRYPNFSKIILQKKVNEEIPLLILKTKKYKA